MYVGIPCRVCVVNSDVKKGNCSQKGIQGPERQRPELVPLQRGVSLTCTTMNVVREVFIGPPATPAACLRRLCRNGDIHFRVGSLQELGIKVKGCA